jgi:hypothetical protein
VAEARANRRHGQNANEHAVDIGAELVQLIAGEMQIGEVVWGKTRQR